VSCIIGEMIKCQVSRSDMNRATKYLMYLQLTFLILTMISALIVRNADPFWKGQMAGVARTYDVFNLTLFVIAIVNFGGFFRRRNWAIYLGKVISLTSISIAVLPLAIKIYTDLYGMEGFSITGEMLATQSIFAILGLVCLTLLSRKSFKL